MFHLNIIVNRMEHVGTTKTGKWATTVLHLAIDEARGRQHHFTKKKQKKNGPAGCSFHTKFVSDACLPASFLLSFSRPSNAMSRSYHSSFMFFLNHERTSVNSI